MNDRLYNDRVIDHGLTSKPLESYLFTVTDIIYNGVSLLSTINELYRYNISLSRVCHLTYPKTDRNSRNIVKSQNQFCTILQTNFVSVIDS